MTLGQLSYDISISPFSLQTVYIYIHIWWKMKLISVDLLNEDVSNSIIILTSSSRYTFTLLRKIKLWKNTSERVVIILSLSLLNSPTFPLYRSSRKKTRQNLLQFQLELVSSSPMEKFRQKKIARLPNCFGNRVTNISSLERRRLWYSGSIILYFLRCTERCLVNSLFRSHSSLLIKRYFNWRLAFVQSACSFYKSVN